MGGGRENAAKNFGQMVFLKITLGEYLSSNVYFQVILQNWDYDFCWGISSTAVALV